MGTGTMKQMGFILLLIVAFSCLTTIIVNFYTIKVLSASRAYINGESQYSKGQKEASALLISYIYSEDPHDFSLFSQAISIPIGDRHARESLSMGSNDDQIAQKGFLQAKNHPSDIPDMIWLFKNFQHIGLFENAITIWKQGDSMVEQLYQTGVNAHTKISLKKITPANKEELIRNINYISAQLTIKQQAFSDTLGIICRKINFYVFLVNVAVTLLIIASIILFMWKTMINMQYSKNKIVEQNNSLQAVNADLDKVIYNVSHDLRSPLASLTGLITLMETETDLTEIRDYLSMMQDSVNKQAKFINDILSSVKNKQNQLVTTECDLSKIVDDILVQNTYSNSGKKIQYHQELAVRKINCDEVSLKVIFNNLISNAIKYSDPEKPNNWIKIKTYLSGSACVIEVEDNGIGIKDHEIDKIFDKFFSAHQHQNNTGIGLYFTKDAVEHIHGTITVNTVPGNGSTFIINIPAA